MRIDAIIRDMETSGDALRLQRQLSDSASDVGEQNPVNLSYNPETATATVSVIVNDIRSRPALDRMLSMLGEETSITMAA